MSFSVGGRELPVYQGDTNQALQAIGQAYGAVNDSYDKLARLPGMAKNMVQDDADARYTAALNKYSNDPNGLAQALANGEIDTSNVRAETLGKTQDTLSNIQKTRMLGYAQSRQENLDRFMDDPTNTQNYFKALRDSQDGNRAGVDSYIASFNGPAEFYKYLKDLDPVTQENWLKDFAQKDRAIAQQGAQLTWDRDKYFTKVRAAQELDWLKAELIKRGYGTSNDLNKDLTLATTFGGEDEDKALHDAYNIIKLSPEILKEWEAFSISNFYNNKGQASNAKQHPNTETADETDTQANSVINRKKN